MSDNVVGDPNARHGTRAPSAERPVEARTRGVNPLKLRNVDELAVAEVINAAGARAYEDSVAGPRSPLAEGLDPNGYDLDSRRV